jgi:lactaldehyde dehydrogenase/glycolaldehyde dehydrogenase
VQKGIYDRFVNRLGEAMKAVQFGDPGHAMTSQWGR